jgi:hypothetical protein
MPHAITVAAALSVTTRLFSTLLAYYLHHPQCRYVTPFPHPWEDLSTGVWFRVKKKW